MLTVKTLEISEKPSLFRTTLPKTNCSCPISCFLNAKVRNSVISLAKAPVFAGPWPEIWRRGRQLRIGFNSLPKLAGS